MRKILVFIKCEMGRTYDVAEKIVWGDLCPRLDSISGDYDLFAEFHVGPDDNIADLIAKHFHSVPGVKDTNTVICFNTFTRDRGVKDTNG